MEDKEFYTCRYDRAFKEVFMKKENKDLLIPLLESILDIKIKELTYLNLEKNSGNVRLKRKHFDLHIKTENENIQIEVNSQMRDYVRYRNVSYLFDTYSHDIIKGEEYDQNTLFVQINFSYGLGENSKYFGKDDDNINLFMLKNNKGKALINNLKYYELNMDYFMNLWYSKDEKLIDKYKYIIMMDLEKDDLSILSKRDKVVEKYMSEVIKVNEEPEFREWISAEKDDLMIENSLKTQFRKEGIEEGRKEGLKIGIQEGRAEGRAEGIKEGKSEGERLAKIETAKNLKQNGVDIEIISKSTGLSKEEIENL